MSNAYRLDSISPSLSQKFRDASGDRRRQAALIACEIAIAEVALEDETVEEAIGKFQRVGATSSEVIGRLESMAHDFDDEYLRLIDCDSVNQISLPLFSKARALSALVFLLREESEEFHEVIYEASKAVADAASLLSEVETLFQ